MISKTLQVLLLSLLAIFPAVAALAQADADYTVGVGDRLAVSIYGKPELSGTFEVRADGQVVLHLLGGIPVAGATVREIEQRIEAEAQERFSSRESVLVDMAEYRSVYVAGVVDIPGAYEYRPGLTVMKAVALAGGLQKAAAETNLDREVEATRRRAMEAREKLTFAEAEQAALAKELARIEEGEVAEAQETLPEGPLGDQHQLVDLRRSLTEGLTEGSERKMILADEEATLFAQRRELINSQLAATQEQLSGMEDLAARGLARREQTLQLEINADEFRSDALEAAAFEARARQTIANAESDIRIAEMEYNHKLLADKIAADQRVALARAELQLALDYLRETDPSAMQGMGDMGAMMQTVYEIHRAGEDGPIMAEPSTPLAPDDLLMVEMVGLQAVGQ